MALFPDEDPEEFLESCVQINEADMNAEFVKVPAQLAYWNNRYAIIYRHWLERKAMKEQLYAQLAIDIRTRLSIGASRVTLTEVESAVLLEPEYQQAKAKEIVAESEKVRLFGILDAIRSKRDMLVSLGANMRAEMQHDPSLRSQAHFDREFNKRG